MIRLNVFLRIGEEKNRKPLIEAAAELVELSRGDSGCLGYDIYSSLTADNCLMICETWKTSHDLDLHQKTDHFKRLSPRLHALSEMTTEQFIY